MQFSKLHGAGNDFVVLDGRGLDRDWAELARRVLDRHFGVGGDGLLLMATSASAPIRMREFNPDGSEAEMSGNGIRCFAKFVLDRGLVPVRKGGLEVETGAGIRTVVPMWANGHVARARVDMGAPVLRSADVPADPSQAGPSDYARLNATLLRELGLTPEELLFDAPVAVEGQLFSVTAVSMGNPHAVAFVDSPVESVPLDSLGPLMEHHAAFPNRVNFHVVNVLGRERLASRTWERGAGGTLACGTGACAMVVAARLHGLVEDSVTVEVPGGVLMISWPGRGPVSMEGPVQEVFAGEWSE